VVRPRGELAIEGDVHMRPRLTTGVMGEAGSMEGEEPEGELSSTPRASIQPLVACGFTSRCRAGWRSPAKLVPGVLVILSLCGGRVKEGGGLFIVNRGM